MIGALLLAACALAAQRTPGPRARLPVPAGDASATQPARDQTIPDAALAQLYQAELDTLYRPTDFPKLRSAHLLLEKYFQAASAKERKSITASLAGMSIDPNALGRMAHIRLHWPELAGGGIFYINQQNGPHLVRYFLGVPQAYDRTRSWPLLMKLTDRADFASDLPTDAKQVVEIYQRWIADELKKHPDALVLMPLPNLDESYGPSYAGMNSAFQPLLDAPNRVNVDPARVYLVGHSVAAEGVWNLALHYPTYFASINPLAGAVPAEFERVRFINLRNTLPLIWHDDDDAVIKIGFARSAVETLKTRKVPVEFDETRGVGHTPTPQIIERDYQKMRSCRRESYPRVVWIETDRPDVIFNRNDWIQIYQQMNPGKERHLYFRHGTGHMTEYEASCSIKGQIKGQRIELTCDNVESFRIYLNDHMIKLSEPITLVVNKKVKFEGMVKPNLDQMLKDQLFLGRGWRYFTAVLDGELGEPPASRPATRPAR